jgi:hypothetical protein
MLHLMYRYEAGLSNLTDWQKAKKQIIFYIDFDESVQGCQMVHIFSNQKSQFVYILECLGIENVGILFGHFTVTWYILLPIGIICGNLVYFSHFGILYQDKTGSPGVHPLHMLLL